jgi:hypothetical protein
MTNEVGNNDSDSIAGFASGEGRQAPQDIFRTVEEILQRLCELCPEIAAIGLTGQMHGILYLNRSGEAVSPLFTLQDQSGLLPTEDNETIAEHLSRETGYRPAAFRLLQGLFRDRRIGDTSLSWGNLPVGRRIAGRREIICDASGKNVQR